MSATTTMLAYIPSPSRGVWELGPLPLRAYALCIIAGIIVAVIWGNRRWIARGGNNGEVLDVAIWAVPFGLIGGRIYHVLTDWPTYFGDGPKEPIDALKVWDGGLGIWGAVAFGAVGAWIGARQLGIKLPSFGDAVAPPILLAQVIGRLGNYFNQELYGRETTVPWGLEIFNRRNDAGVVGPNVMDGVSNGEVVAVVHPTFLYEMLWSLLVVVLLVVADRQFRIGHGRLFALYVAGYCVGRFGVELMRDDHATLIAGVRINVFTAALVFVGAAIYFVVAPKGRELGLSMFHPDRAEELEELGDVGYVDQYYDRDYPDDDRGTAARDATVATGPAGVGAATAVLAKTRESSGNDDDSGNGDDSGAVNDDAGGADVVTEAAPEWVDPDETEPDETEPDETEADATEADTLTASEEPAGEEAAVQEPVSDESETDEPATLANAAEDTDTSAAAEDTDASDADTDASDADDDTDTSAAAEDTDEGSDTEESDRTNDA